MSRPKPPDPAKLVIGSFVKDKSVFESAVSFFIEKFGEVDMISPWYPFDRTTYYQKEMGGPLLRRFVVIRELIAQTDLVRIKLLTNAFENTCSENGRRKINIDPGYLTLERFVLATGKNFTHRIYLGEGIYADLTLIFQKGEFRFLPWTYPDYQDQKVPAFLQKVRGKYIWDLKWLSRHAGCPLKQKSDVRRDVTRVSSGGNFINSINKEKNAHDKQHDRVCNGGKNRKRPNHSR